MMDRMEGRAKQLRGGARKRIGLSRRDPAQQIAGEVDQAKGATQRARGKLRSRFRKAS